MSKPEIKRMLALYFGTSISGEGIPDIEGEAEFDLEELQMNNIRKKRTDRRTA